MTRTLSLLLCAAVPCLAAPPADPPKSLPEVIVSATDWIRWLWEVEAEHPPMVGSRLKFDLPVQAQPARNSRSRRKVALRA